jgi:hypothetical protein
MLGLQRSIPSQTQQKSQDLCIIPILVLTIIAGGTPMTVEHNLTISPLQNA